MTVLPLRSPSILQTPARKRVIPSEMPLPAGHPHTRKQSVQLNIQQPSESLSLAPIADLHSSPIPLTPLAPSPLSQSIVYNPSTPSPPPPPSPSQAPEQQSRSNSAPPPKLGLGIELSSPPRPSVSRSLSGGPRSPSNFNPPGYETLLWAYAQLSGTVEFDPAFSRPEAVRHLTAKLAKRPVGGGSLDLKESMYNPAAASPLGGLGALLGFGSPSPLGSPTPGTPGRGGFLSSMFSPRPTPARSDGASGGAAPSGSLTTFEPPQSLLAVDLALAPGESKSYTYRVTLPSELPPTFRGRALRFSYHVIVGTCKGVPHMENQTRLLKVPLRVYNHIPVGRPPPVYDLLWPSRARTSLLQSAEVEEIGTPPSTDPIRLNRHKNSGESRSGKTNAELTALQQFGRSLRDTKQGFEDQGVEEQSEGALRGCRTAIEIMTRQPSKASYDVNKGGHPVAILTLPKTIFRLGESVHGTIEINCFDSVPISVLKVCVLLEAHESLPARLRTTGKGLLALRKVHGEHHDSQTAHTRRTTFALDIPSDGVPAFRVANESGDREQLGGLEWRLRICFLVSENGLPMVKESGAGEWGKTWAASDAINEGAVETVECEVGIVVLPSHTLFASVPLKFGV